MIYSQVMKASIAVLVLLLSMALQLCHSKEKGAYYVTRFMVQVDGDRKMADKVARAHGMRNMGQVNEKIYQSSDVYTCSCTQ